MTGFLDIYKHREREKTFMAELQQHALLIPMLTRLLVTYILLSKLIN